MMSAKSSLEVAFEKLEFLKNQSGVPFMKQTTHSETSLTTLLEFELNKLREIDPELISDEIDLTDMYTDVVTNCAQTN